MITRPKEQDKRYLLTLTPCIHPDHLYHYPPHSPVPHTHSPPSQSPCPPPPQRSPRYLLMWTHCTPSWQLSDMRTQLRWPPSWRSAGKSSLEPSMMSSPSSTVLSWLRYLDWHKIFLESYLGPPCCYWRERRRRRKPDRPNSWSWKPVPHQPASHRQRDPERVRRHQGSLRVAAARHREAGQRGFLVLPWVPSISGGGQTKKKHELILNLQTILYFYLKSRWVTTWKARVGQSGFLEVKLTSPFFSPGRWDEDSKYCHQLIIHIICLCQLSLVAPPSPREAAVSAFTSLDADQSGFIPSTRWYCSPVQMESKDCENQPTFGVKKPAHISFSSLATLMQNLGLFAEEEYVELMRAKMDSEGLGIILIHQVILSPCDPWI